jgi:subtilase family serine protease
MRTARWWALIGAAGLAALMAVPTAAGAASHPRPVSGPSGFAAKIRQHPVGAVAKSARVDFDLVLRLRDAAGAQALLKAVSTPGSSSYRHYLSTAAWEARFSPTASAVSRARSWLRSQGFTVGTVSKDRITISASGTAAQVEKAFRTGLGYYRVHGRTVRLTTGSASVPRSISASVVGPMGLNQTISMPAIAGAAGAAARVNARAASGVQFPPPPPAFITAPPCGAYYNQKIATVTPPFGNGYPSKVPYQVCGYKPGQFRSVYNVGSDTGKGTTVAIVDAYGSATIAQDATKYFSLNDPGNPFSGAAFSQALAAPFTNESLCGASSWLVEQAIDVESVHAMARGTHILYVGAQSCLNTDLFNADQFVIDNRLADAVTNSWGDPSGDVLDPVTYRTAFDALFQLAGSTGMTVSFSTGDDGDNFNLTGISAPGYPASSPFVTAVGGTSLQIGANGQRIGDLGWATGRSFKCTKNAVNGLPGCTSSNVNTWLPASYNSGSGGYTSYNYPEPYYQAPIVPSVLATRNFTAPARVIPDISLDADPSTGFLIGLTEVFPNGTVGYNQPRYGGTSLASPLLAGVIADVDGASLAAGRADVGFINPAIYRLSTKPGAIYDVVPGGNQGQIRVDHAFTYLGPGAKGFLTSFRELTYEGPIVYCDGTGNCATRNNTLTTAKGYDSMTGLGAPGPSFIADMSGP